jgi:hypothetical protein
MFTTTISARRTVLRIGVVCRRRPRRRRCPARRGSGPRHHPARRRRAGWLSPSSPSGSPTSATDASTTRLQVTLPEDQPLGAVSTTPIPGWTVKTSTRQLDQPIEMFV